MKKIIFMMMVFAVLSVGCNRDEINYYINEPQPEEFTVHHKCAPENYKILFNGEQYTWQLYNAFICPVYFDTIQQAIDDSWVYKYAYDHHMDRYEIAWEEVECE